MSVGRHDAIVVGVGGMGGAACRELARRGLQVLGLERHAIGHALGSSHGESRLIRQAYFERPDYVPLARRAYELWDELARESSEALLVRNGLVIFGPGGAGIVAGVRESARLHGIPIRDATGTAALRPPPGLEGVLEPGAGFLRVEACVQAQVASARRHGAKIVEGVIVRGWRETRDEVIVDTDQGEHRASVLIATPGPWAPGLLPRVASLKACRVPLLWFRGEEDFTVAAGEPCFGFELEDGFFYGVPAISERGVKVGLHIAGETVEDPAGVDRRLRDGELAQLQAFVRRCLPRVTAELTGYAICLYTMSPDGDFLIDRQGRVAYACGFSGHGFKFATVVGEILADLAIQGETRHPIDFLRQRWRDH